MSSFKEYMLKALQNEKEEIRKKNNKIDINESAFNQYLKKHRISINEEEAVKTETEIDDDMVEDDDAATDNSSEEEEEVEEDEDDSEDDYEKDEDEEAMNTSCPIPTQDQTVNIENRQKAIDDFSYGPENVTESNDEFWNDKKSKFMVKTIELAKAKKCGNCAAFTLKSAMLACLDKGIDKTVDENDTWDSDKENRGYCDFLDFKCHAQRTCDSWVEGGPLTDSK
jgi:hypothetical protein